MAGIYFHIPFCRKACHYCNFHFSTFTSNINEMVQAICMEMELRRYYINEPVSTIYFGGGTPSLLSHESLQLLIIKSKQLFVINNDAEITLETNPDDITKEKAKTWRSIGVNRLSIGIQSFFEDDLKWMNRVHTAQQALQSIEIVQAAGFDNINIDLIYGTPVLTDEKWKQNVHQAISLNIPHLSCYALTVEPKTALKKLIQQHKIENIDAEKQSRHFELLMQWMSKAGYQHYEISNFAKPGYRSRHNSSYWQGNHYIGVGPSAHSFNGNSRQWNIANNALYIKTITHGAIPFEIEQLTVTQQLNEYIMTSLRTTEGLSLPFIMQKWDENLSNSILKDAQPWIVNKKMVFDNNHLVLTNKGKLFADGIAAQLFR